MCINVNNSCTVITEVRVRRESLKPMLVKYADLGWVCVPVLAESYGAWGLEAMDFFSKIASRIATSVGKSKSVVLHEIYGRLTVSQLLRYCEEYTFPCCGKTFFINNSCEFDEYKTKKTFPPKNVAAVAQYCAVARERVKHAQLSEPMLWQYCQGTCHLSFSSLIHLLYVSKTYQCITCIFQK